MKNKILCLLLITSICAFAQDQSVGDFYKVTAFDQIDVQLVPSDENKVLLNGAGSEDVQLVNKDGELKIRMPLTKMLSGDDVSATVFYTNLHAVEANEGSRIGGASAIVTTDFDIIVKEGSTVSLTLEVEKLNVRVNDGSKVTLQGTARHQEVIINSGSAYEAENLQSKFATISANTGGKGAVRASELVDAKCRAGGEIAVFGKPKRMLEKTIAGGTIYKAGD